MLTCNYAPFTGHNGTLLLTGHMPPRSEQPSVPESLQRSATTTERDTFLDRRLRRGGRGRERGSCSDVKTKRTSLCVKSDFLPDSREKGRL